MAKPKTQRRASAQKKVSALHDNHDFDSDDVELTQADIIKRAIEDANAAFEKFSNDI